MKKKLSIFIITCAFSLLSLQSTGVSASEVTPKHTHDHHSHDVLEENLIQPLLFSEEGRSPRYVASCPGGGKHAMAGISRAFVYSGSYSNPGKLLLLEQGYQCKKCYLVVASENNVFYGGVSLGKYAIVSTYGNISTGPVKVYGGLAGTFNGSLASDLFWSGFEWYPYL